MTSPLRIAREQREDLLAAIPAAVAIVRGPDHVFEFANDQYLALVGDAAIVGRKCCDVLPQPTQRDSVRLLDSVYASGEPYFARETETPVAVGPEGGATRRWLNIALLPLFEGGNVVRGVLIHAVDVTELVTSRESARQLAQTLEATFERMPAAAVLVEAPAGRPTLANRIWRELFGTPAHGTPASDQYAAAQGASPDGRPYRAEEYPTMRSLTNGEIVDSEAIAFSVASGERRTMSVSSAPIRDAAGRITAAIATFFDVTERQWAEGLLHDQNRVLELIATGCPLAEALEALVEMIESRSDGLRASILLLDDDRRALLHGAAPSLPDEYNEAIHGLAIGPAAGSCGTAAFTGRRVIVTDIEHDPLWADFKELALPHGLRACWSTPIRAPDGAVLGTFAVYYDDPIAPRPRDIELIDIVNRTAAIAISRTRLEEQRERTLRVVQTLNGVGQALGSIGQLEAVVQTVTDAATDVTGADFGAFFYNVVGDDGESYALYTLSGVPREAFANFPMPRNTAIFGPTFRGEAVMRLDDVTADPRYGQSAPYHGLPPGHLPVRSHLAVPVKMADEVIGGLFFGHAEPGQFTAEHEELVVGIAAQAAVAITNARLYEAEQRARAEAERRAQAAFSLEQIDDGVVLVDDDGRVRVWNRAASVITGVAESAATGKRLDDVVPGWDEATAQLRSGASGSSQTVPLDLGRREAWLSITASRFSGGIVFAFTDVTDERRLDAIRNDVIATVSHELRTPVTAVFGAVKTLERDDIRANPELSSSLFGIVKSESERLVQLVEQILDASKLDSGSLTLNAEGVDALAAARAAAETFAVGGFRVNVHGRPVHVLADEHRLHQVLDNLIDNGLKYGEGPVEVEVSGRGEHVRIAVADSGPGVPPSERTRVFEKFVRLDPEMHSGVNGSGLGLYISRELVVRMGGRMWIESRGDGGTGAVFVVVLPAAK